MPDLFELQLRPYRPDDREPLVDLWHRCGLVIPANHPTRDIAMKLHRDAAGLIVGEIVTNRSFDLIASVMVGYEGHRGWVNYVAVDPAHRRCGFGRALIDHAEAWLRERGCPKLNLQVRSSNAQVRAFYEAIGFRQDAVVSFGKRLDNR